MCQHYCVCIIIEYSLLVCGSRCNEGHVGAPFYVPFVILQFEESKWWALLKVASRILAELIRLFIIYITENTHRTEGLLPGDSLCGCKPTSKYVASGYSLLSFNKQSYFQFVIVFTRTHQMVLFVRNMKAAVTAYKWNGSSLL